jgi:prepilin signal peptidase PulO-like enzyme (type II secretory pathway)
VIFVLCWLFLPGNIIERISYLGISTCMIVIFFSDLKYQLISEKILLAMIFFSTVFFLKNPTDHLMGAIVLSLLLYLIHFFSKGRGMGFGDVELAFVMGWFQGLKLGFISLYLSFILGGLFAAVFVLYQGMNNKRKSKIMKSKIAFGPFIVLSMFLTMFFSKQLLDVFQKIFGLL